MKCRRTLTSSEHCMKDAYETDSKADAIRINALSGKNLVASGRPEVPIKDRPIQTTQDKHTIK